MDFFLHVGGNPTLHFPHTEPGQRFSCALPKQVAAHDLSSSTHSPGTLLSPKTMNWQTIIKTAVVADRIFMFFLPEKHSVTQIAVEVLPAGVQNNMFVGNVGCGCDAIGTIGALSRCAACNTAASLTPFAIDFLETQLCCGAAPNPVGTVLTLPASVSGARLATAAAWGQAQTVISAAPGHVVAFGWTVTALPSGLGCNLAKLGAAYAQTYKTHDFRFPVSY